VQIPAAVPLLLLGAAVVPAAEAAPRVPKVSLVPGVSKEPPKQLRAEQELVTTIVDDGRVTFREHCDQAVLGAVLGAVFAFVAPFMGGPYSGWWSEGTEARMVGDYLDATRDRRACMRERTLSGRSQAALYHLRHKLTRIWSNHHVSLAARRRLLFEEWDAWTEDETGRLARATVVGFIRRVLPEGSPQGFRNEELVQLNVLRTSQATFSPYDDP
jgi:hypothetical protein